ncbi:GNAT family N-acetyltransferase [Microvirga sp. Mcv34]|uniref:GNAT family N-acetyltransferase n=1 Tax=Microvirga sp. Mcv34 TaxID=2926016 RepID=UPI0021C623F8|nr:GNAT family N-acetyltransferase [Microvirga sp. Mcv34]
MPIGRILIDTNVLIPLEDATEVPETHAALLRTLAEQGITVFVHRASYDDISRDKNIARRKQSISKLAKYPVFEKVIVSEETLSKEFGQISNKNDLCDCYILKTISDDLCDFLISEDNGLHKRAAAVGLGQRVLRVREALDLIKGVYVDAEISLHRVEDVFCYQLDKNDPIFFSLRDDYDEFDDWFEKCCKLNRKAWIVRDGNGICGLVIVKDETNETDIPRFQESRLLKVCTFKIADTYRGGRLGEHLLRKILWYAFESKYQVVYLTAFEKQYHLRELLAYFGFKELGQNARGEIITYKEWPANIEDAEDDYDFHRLAYPERRIGTSSAYIIPIWPVYHQRLFPEGTKKTSSQLELFSENDADPRTPPSNSIRKVYLCSSPTKKIKRGSFVYFYMTQDDAFSASQRITCVGVVDSFREISCISELIAATAKRSVYSIAEQEVLLRKGPVKVLDFIMLGYCQPALNLERLLELNILRAHPQSIVKITERQHSVLQSVVNISLRPES